MNNLPLKLILFSFIAATFAEAADRAVIYSPVGKRDPFKPPAVTAGGRGLTTVAPIEKFTVEQLQLRAVLRGLGTTRAMLEDPDGRTYIVKEGDAIGRERATVSRILNSEVIVTERSFNYLGEETLYEKILSLPADPEIDNGRDARPAPAAPKNPDGASNNSVAAPVNSVPVGNSGGGGNGDGLVY